MKHYFAGSSAIAILATLGQGSAAGQAAPAPGKGPQLEQIIVTATHRKENLQKTAIAVTAVSAASLQAAGVVQARDLSKTVAGLSITASGPSSQIYLRGVGTFSVDAYTSSPVSTNLDGVNLSMPPMINGLFYDVSRVEVLKGPQGTLYGRNATAGAINIITNQPTSTMNGYADFELGNYGLFRTSGAVNVPLTDQLDIRLAGQFLNRNGYYSDNTGRTGDDAVRFQARYRPTEDIELTLGADYQHATGQEEPLVVVGANPTNPWEGPTTAASNRNIIAARNPADPYGVGLPPFFSQLLPAITSADLGLRNDSAGLRADLEWNLGFANLSFISSYRHLATLFNTDPGFLSGETEMGHQFTEELRLASPDNAGPWKWQAGLYYFDNSAFQHKLIDEGFTAPPQSYTDTDQSAAAFGDLTYSILPHLRITGGLRGTTETVTQSGSAAVIDTPAAYASLSGYLAASHVPGFLIPSIVDATLQPIHYSLSNGATFRNLSVKAGAEYDVAPNSLAYASFTTGFKSGGIIADLNTPLVSNVYKPEMLEAYAIGSKNRLFGGAVQANAEAFYWDYKNHQEIYLTQQQADPLISSPLTHNIGAATVKGFSLDTLYRPTANDLFSLQLEYLDSTFDNFTYYEYTTPGYKPSTGCPTQFLRLVQIAGQTQALNNVDCSGKPFTRAPHFSINLSLQHTFELGGNRGSLFAVISSHITTSQWLAVDYTPLEHEGGLTVTDFNLTYEPPKGGWSVTGYVRNIENTASYSSAFAYAFASNVTLAGINPPRTFGGIFKVRF
jgi:iron complex outermembrane receptor protein